MARKLEFKPLLFTTTIRNPERLKALLWVLKHFDGQVLNDNLAIKIVKETIKYGLYRPMHVSNNVAKKWSTTRKGEFANMILTDDEVNNVIESNPQQHKEAGFGKGFPSRFATMFDFAKELGFVYYKPNEQIFFSKLGNLMASVYSVVEDDNTLLVQEEHPEYEQQVFLLAMCKYQRRNPFVRVLNENVPLILLLQTIQKLNSDEEYNGSGISRKELPLLIFWKDGNADALYKRIKTLRHKYGYSPSDDIIADICTREIMGGFKQFKLKSIVDEYPDEFIRKMRLTGLISIRGAGRFIDINKNEIDKVNYVLSNYSTYSKYHTEREYFDYASSIDDNLISIKSKDVTTSQSELLLQRWIEIYSWDMIKEELLNLSHHRLSKDDTLRILPQPARLEFLTALAIKSRIPGVSVIPNYPCDDEGLPVSTAGGNKGDIKCIECDNKAILVEVTLAEGQTQTKAEVWPISRHLETLSLEYSSYSSQCIFIAPSIFSDSLSQIKWCKWEKNQTIRPYNIPEFISFLDESEALYV